METKTIILIFLAFLTLWCLIYSIVRDKFDFPTAMSGVFLMSFMQAFLTNTSPHHITIEKSSDSEWVKSDKDYGDTSITEVKIIKYQGKTDTVYPTIIYKRINL